MLAIVYGMIAAVFATLLALLALSRRGAVEREGAGGVGVRVLDGVGWGGAVAILLPPLLLAAGLGRDLAEFWLPKLLPVAGLGHFLVLAASFQVPARLGWAEELPRLRPLNRKLMWTYGGFTVLTIVAFGVLTLLLRKDMLKGDRAAVALAGFIGVYWAARIGVDVFYFRHEDWPKGRGLALGHALLLGLFAFLAATYLGLVAWRLLA